ncbi:fimbrial protein [Photobacterium leiognathi]|uniref:fimbrial protein n=1 Tax=Photobacterium leiognathi TaxID=553611 RepID=UPI002981AC28|nr:fimbrial protein [Photobacterium leiognathi]
MTTFNITGNIVIPTCIINGGKSGLSQEINMGDYNIVTDVEKKIEIPLKINCSGSTGLGGVILDVSPLDKYYYKNNGLIKTTLDGIGILLSWKSDNTMVNFSEKKIFSNNNNNFFDSTMHAKVKKLSKDTFSKGLFESKVQVTLSYY